MATVPLYLAFGDLVGTNGGHSVVATQMATATNPPATTSGLVSWYFGHASANRRYDFAGRSWGGGGLPQKHTDPLDPTGQGWHPLSWNHDSTYAGTEPVVSTITTGATTLLTLTIAGGSHGRSDGATAEVLISGVGGADAAQINRTWVATFRSTNRIEIPLDSSGLTLTASGIVKIPSWFPFGDSIASVLRGVTNTDRSVGGKLRELTGDTGEEAKFGIEVALAADVHDFHGPRGERAHLFTHAPLPALSARLPVSITAGTNASSAVITATAHRAFQDFGRDVPVIVYGLTGSWAGANGQRTARVVDENTLELVGVNSSAWGALPAGGFVLAEQRGRKVYGENYADALDRVAEAISAIEDRGDTASIAGVVLGYGKREVRYCAGQQLRVGSLRASSVQTGFPTRITLTAPVQLATPSAGRALLVADIDGAGGELTGRHELVPVSSTVIDVLVETTAAVDPDDVRIEIGDPVQWFGDDIAELVADLRADLASLTGQAAADLPVALLRPRYLSRDSWDGKLAHPRTPSNDTRVQQGIGRLESDADNVGVIETRDLELRADSAEFPARDSLFQIGHRAFEEVRRLADGVETRDRGVPLYVVVGDSYGAGTANYLWAWTNGDPNYDGTHEGPRGIKVYDWRSGSFQEYTAVAYANGLAIPGNGNTFEVYDSNLAVGPEMSFFLERKKAHPSTEVRFLKLSVNGAGLTDIRLTNQVQTVTVVGSTVTIEVPGSPSGAQYGHGRNVPGQVIAVEIAGMATGGISGIPDGIYSATVVDFRTLTITVAGVTGTYTAGATVKVPQPDWRRSSADLWPYLEDGFRAACDAILAEGKLPDVRGVVVFEGTNDALFGDPSAWLEQAQQFVADLRELLTTRSAPTPALPIAWQMVRSLPNPPGGQTAIDNIAAMRASAIALAAADPALAVFDLDSTNENDLEATRVPIATDDIHLTGEGYLTAGKLAENALASVDQSCAAVPGSEGGSASPSSSPSSSEPSAAPAAPESSTTTASATTATSDLIATARDIIARCDAAIASGLSVLSYSVNGRTVTHHSLTEIRATRDYYAKILRNAAGYRRSLATFGGDT